MKDTNYSVYLIKLGEDVMYVGKTNDFRGRKNEHRGRIGTKHSAIPVGTDLSKITIIKVKDFSDRNEALKHEGELILQYDTINNGWNKQRSGNISIEDREAYNKKYKEEHKAEIKAQKKRYKEAHKEEVLAYDKKYKEEHREERNAYFREYNKKRKLKKEENI